MTSSAVRYRVIHETRYRYEYPVSVSRQQLHLTPRECPWQSVIAHEIAIDPEPTLCHTSLDHLGNPIRQFAIEAPHSALTVRAESRIEVFSHCPDIEASPPWEAVQQALALSLGADT